MDDTTLTFIGVLVGVIVGIVLPMFTTDVSASTHKIIVAIMGVLGVLAAMLAIGSLVAPAFFVALILGYTSALAANTNMSMRMLRRQMELQED
jgi:ABC-type microcin C transport system permease subunit YejE